MVQTWIGLCLVVRFLHPLIGGPRRRRRLRGPWPRRSLPRAGQIPPRGGRNVRDLPVSRFSLWKMVRIRRPFPAGRRTVPRTPLLLLKVLMLPAVPAPAVLPALALVHGERINVIHHASITVRASHIHSPSQHCRFVHLHETHTTGRSDRDWVRWALRGAVGLSNGRGAAWSGRRALRRPMAASGGAPGPRPAPAPALARLH